MKPANKSVLLSVIGDSPRAKVLDFLLAHAGFDYSKTQVARESGISRATIDKIWPTLAKEGMIHSTRSIANARLYALDMANPDVKALAQLENELAKARAGREAHDYAVKARA